MINWFSHCVIITLVPCWFTWTELIRTARYKKITNTNFFSTIFYFYTLVNRQLSGSWNLQHRSHIPGLVYPTLTCRLHNYIWFWLVESCWLFTFGNTLGFMNHLVELLPFEKKNYFPPFWIEYFDLVTPDIWKKKNFFFGRTSQIFFIHNSFIVQLI